MDPHDWFEVSELTPGVWRILEPGHVCFWLVCGQRRAALIDTGCGIAALRPVIERLTELPVTVVHTHHHWDHAGGDGEFSEVLVHRAGVDGLAAGVSPELIDRYARYAREMSAAYPRWRELDERFFHLAGDEHRVRPWPTGLDGSNWRIPGGRADGELCDGQLLDLGARSLRVWHTPGHSPDCVSLELVGEGMLIGGDTVNTGPVYLQLTSSDLAEQHASLTRLAHSAEHWPRILCAHFLRTEVDPSFLHAQIEALEQVQAGVATLRPAVDCLGDTVLEACFDGFSLLLPAAKHTVTRAGGYGV